MASLAGDRVKYPIEVYVSIRCGRDKQEAFGVKLAAKDRAERREALANEILQLLRRRLRVLGAQVHA